ncbi:MAG: Stp1/IreP family PP2C-type Ser/Thr phosphatase [Deltaproteobacteria bacterium]|jgi:protein phosphatase|nr:Stp1/IreP family PP2C-type Ser/Thr phosphatase [Deltaproteobacteria bacterium]
MPEINFVGKSDSGLKRRNNEDRFMVRSELGFCLVADGMGGAAAGEIASRIFAETTLEIFSTSAGRSEKDTIELVQRAFNFANERILSHVKKNPHHKGMGCTAELMAFSDKGFVIGHIGDSRTYCLRDGQLKQLTQDHSLVQNQIDQRLITPAEARNHPLRNVILRAVGIKKKLALDLIRGIMFSGDLFLLCSDGLSDMVDDNQIRNILFSTAPLLQKVEKLIESANAAGGYDNITVVLADI